MLWHGGRGHEPKQPLTFPKAHLYFFFEKGFLLVKKKPSGSLQQGLAALQLA
jgi:hypothetical protein